MPKKLTLAFLATAFITILLSNQIALWLRVNYPTTNPFLVEPLAYVAATIIIYYVWKQLKIPQE